MIKDIFFVTVITTSPKCSKPPCPVRLPQIFAPHSPNLSVNRSIVQSRGLRFLSSSFLVSTVRMVQFGTGIVRLAPSTVLLDFDLTLKQILMLSAFKFN